MSRLKGSSGKSGEPLRRMKGLLQIGPRYVKQDADGLRPFQRQAFERLKRFEPFKLFKLFDARLIFVEEMMGSKKSLCFKT